MEQPRQRRKASQPSWKTGAALVSEPDDIGLRFGYTLPTIDGKGALRRHAKKDMKPSVASRNELDMRMAARTWRAASQGNRAAAMEFHICDLALRIERKVSLADARRRRNRVTEQQRRLQAAKVAIHQRSRSQEALQGHPGRRRPRTSGPEDSADDSKSRKPRSDLVVLCPRSKTFLRPTDKLPSTSPFLAAKTFYPGSRAHSKLSEDLSSSGATSAKLPTLNVSLPDIVSELRDICDEGSKKRGLESPVSSVKKPLVRFRNFSGDTERGSRLSASFSSKLSSAGAARTPAHRGIVHMYHTELIDNPFTETVRPPTAKINRDVARLNRKPDRMYTWLGYKDQDQLAGITAGKPFRVQVVRKGSHALQRHFSVSDFSKPETSAGASRGSSSKVATRRSGGGAALRRFRVAARAVQAALRFMTPLRLCHVPSEDFLGVDPDFLLLRLPTGYGPRKI